MPVNYAEAEKNARAEAHFILGRALMGQNRFEEAESELRQAIRIRPDHLTALTNLRVDLDALG